MEGNIKKIRKLLNLSQAELGLLLGVHSMTVSKWERGILKPRPIQAACLDAYSKICWTEKRKQKLKLNLVSKGVVETQMYIYNLIQKGKKCQSLKNSASCIP